MIDCQKRLFLKGSMHISEFKSESHVQTAILSHQTELEEFSIIIVS